MNRKYFRLVCVAAILFALNFAMLSTAEARSLSGSHKAVSGTHDVWSAATAWLAGLLPGGAVKRPVSHTSAASSTGGTYGGGGYQTQTGPCIDPLGGTRCQL
jgi:hypothetical protein